MKISLSSLSLKWQIQLWHGLVLAIVVTVLGVLFYQHERTARLNALDNALDRQIHPLVNHGAVQTGNRPSPHGKSRRRPPLDHHGGPPSGHPRGPRGDRPGGRPSAPPGDPPMGKLIKFFPESPDSKRTVPETRETIGEWTDISYTEKAQTSELGSGDPTVDFINNMVPQGYYAVVWSARGDQCYFRTENAKGIEHPQLPSEGYWRRYAQHESREIFHSTPSVAVLIGIQLPYFESEMKTLRTQIIASGFCILLIGMLIGYILVSVSLSPLKLISKSSHAIAKGKLDERIPEQASTGSHEVSLLTRDLNHSFEQLEQLFDQQREFTANASHELRTPLTALLTHLELGKNHQRSPEETTQILEVCHRSAARLKHIVDDLLEIYLFDSGKVVLEKIELPSSTLLGNLTEDLLPMIEDKGCTLTYDSDTSELTGDPFRIEQVITNLINNAIQHNDSPVNLQLKSYTEGTTSVIEVIDDGKGINPDHIDHLFVRFYREDSSRKNGSKNAGLGLAISKAIVEAHGGSLTVISTPNVKTTFTISLPKE